MKLIKDFSFNKEKLAIVIYFLLTQASIREGFALQLVEPTKPISIQNGSTSGVIIDCPYELGTNDTHGLEIKWYYSNKPRPVYQWIPGNKPQDLGRLNGRVDLSYEVTQDEYKKHRALSIPHPTLELSGKYSCWVSNFLQEEKMDILLTVYTPANKLQANYERLNRDAVTISCRAEGLYPEPRLSLYRMVSSSGTYRFEDAETHTEFDSENGTFSIALERNFKHSELDEGDFLCSLTIPNTEYQLDKEISYCPDGAVSLEFTVKLLSISTLIVLFHNLQYKSYH